MGDRHCLGCGTELTGEVITLEHSLPQWLAREIEMPGVALRHFMHDETQPEGESADALLAGGVTDHSTELRLFELPAADEAISLRGSCAALGVRQTLLLGIACNGPDWRKQSSDSRVIRGSRTSNRPSTINRWIAPVEICSSLARADRANPSTWARLLLPSVVR